MAILSISIALKKVYPVLVWVLIVSYWIFTQTALIKLTFSLEGSFTTFALLVNSNAD
jgi:hypothetical protein